MTKPEEKEVEVIEHENHLPLASSSTVQQLSPLQQMQQAKEMGLSIDEMKEMMALQKEFEANEARKAFHVALAEFKKNPPRVVKDALNQKYGSAYTTIGNMVNIVNEAMGPFGLSSRWDFPETTDNTIKCACILSHTLGHEEKVTLTGMPDTSGSKNPLQERKSARTYLKLETFEAVTGMASVEGNINDDGNSSGKARAPEIVCITEEQSLIIDSKIKENDLDISIFTKWLGKKCPYTKGNVDKLSVDHYSIVIAQIEKSIKNKKESNNDNS